MHFTSVPDTLTKIAQLGDVTLYERAGDRPVQEKPRPRQRFDLMDCISHVTTPTGLKPVMKAMVTTACERNCFYCPFRAGRNQTTRATFTPDELAGAFDRLQAAQRVDGMFLSSGIIRGSVTSQDKIIDTAEIVRGKYNYGGYVHLKIMPGIEYDQLYRAMQLADRVSVNLEGPTQQRLESLAPKKDFLDELVRMLQWAHRIRQEHPHEKLASTVTQFVVGAVGDTDLELLNVSQRLYHQMRLSRVYYQAFNPVLGTPFEDLPPADHRREFRLYQSSFLLRDYNWDVEELPFVDGGNLRTDVDPKRAWADLHLRHAPIDIMTAERDQLLRIPGIGPKSAGAILVARRRGQLRDFTHLRQIGIRAPEQSAPYILLNGRRPPQQLSLFGD